MANEIEAVLIPVAERESVGECLAQYLSNDALKTKKFLPGPIAAADTEIFNKNVLNITTRLDEFVASKKKEVAYLVLGKIQSGKTANLLATVAWAADSKISIATIFTGVTGALNEQTVDRIKRDLIANLDEQFIKVLTVPTKSSGKDYESLEDEVTKWVKRRSGNVIEGLIRPLPVLVTLKNPARVKTLNHLIASMHSKFGDQFISLLIDDEADQASQNAGASKDKIAATYGAIKDLRDLPSRNILLSYTATPQAVLLTLRSGRLRPNYCVTVAPRTGYFGLENAVQPNFATNRKTVVDWDKKPTQMKVAPESLRRAIIQFVWTGWIRFQKESLFYAKSGFSGELLGSQLKSLQMLVHESGATIQHAKVYEFVKGEVERLTDGLTNAVTGEFNATQLSDLASEWGGVLEDIKIGLNGELAGSLNIDLDQNTFKQLLSLLDDSKILVVNSASTRPGPHMDMPISNPEWEQSKLWFLIGGDILGRGLTIPQMTATYFLRHAKSPNFDTISQQMRFCGYRENYAHFTYLFAEQRTFELFEFMNQIDTAIWRMARKWDITRLDIFSEMPPIMYASRPDVRLDPCRRAVRDPNLTDKKITGDVIFSSHDIFNPNNVRANLHRLQSFIYESKLIGQNIGDWIKYSEPTDLQMQRILSTWDTNQTEQSHLIGAAELFAHELEELGLSYIPRNIIVHRSLVDYSPGEIESLINATSNFRRLTDARKEHNFENWKKLFTDTSLIAAGDKRWPTLAVQHIGDGQRKIRDQHGDGATVLLIEPLFGTTTARKADSKIALGIAFTLMTPPNFEIRMIGLPAKVEQVLSRS